MKKRILSIILVISCLLLITGCGKKDSGSEQESVQGDEAAQEEAVSGEEPSDDAFFLCSALHICTINSNGTTLMSGRKETMRT